MHPKPIAFSGKRPRKIDGKDEDVFVDCVLQYNDSYNDQVLCFTNTIHNPDGGTHLTGFRTALTRAINQYAKSEQSAEGKRPADLRRRRARRLDGVLSVKLPNPHFESQTKVKLREHGS